jgi:hypothetical protein
MVRNRVLLMDGPTSEQVFTSGKTNHAFSFRVRYKDGIEVNAEIYVSHLMWDFTMGGRDEWWSFRGQTNSGRPMRVKGSFNFKDKVGWMDIR